MKLILNKSLLRVPFWDHQVSKVKNQCQNRVHGLLKFPDTKIVERLNKVLPVLLAINLVQKLLSEVEKYGVILNLKLILSWKDQTEFLEGIFFQEIGKTVKNVVVLVSLVQLDHSGLLKEISLNLGPNYDLSFGVVENLSELPKSGGVFVPLGFRVSNHLQEIRAPHYLFLQLECVSIRVLMVVFD